MARIPRPKLGHVKRTKRVSKTATTLSRKKINARKARIKERKACIKERKATVREKKHIDKLIHVVVERKKKIKTLIDIMYSREKTGTNSLKQGIKRLEEALATGSKLKGCQINIINSRYFFKLLLDDVTEALRLVDLNFRTLDKINSHLVNLKFKTLDKIKTPSKKRLKQFQTNEDIRPLNTEQEKMYNLHDLTNFMIKQKLILKFESFTKSLEELDRRIEKQK